MDFLTLLQVLDTTIRLATPLLLACLAGLFSERAGIFDIGLEGKMLASAFLTAAVAAQGRAQALQSARQAAEEAEGRERFRRFMGN